MRHYLFLVAIWVAGCTTPDKDKVTIAVAANMQYAIEEIRGEFTKQTGVGAEIVISSSGKLSAQIMEGAPFDVFISADTRYPGYLYEQGKAVNQPTIYAYGQLVVWGMHGPLEWSTELFEISGDEKIAIPNPEIAPYGIAARQSMETLGVFDSLNGRFVYGESVSQTNQYILSGAVRFGFTALSVVKSEQMQSKGFWVMVPKELYGDIPQAMVLVNNGQSDTENGKRFVDFMQSDPAQRILHEFGYLVPADF